MQVKRIVANIATEDVAAARRFYQDLLGLDLLMDWLDRDLRLIPEDERAGQHRVRRRLRYAGARSLDRSR